MLTGCLKVDFWRILHLSLCVTVNLSVVVDNYDMCLRSAYVAILYMDQFFNLGNGLVSVERGQLLGAACLHVA